jgi:hypothetical protein
MRLSDHRGYGISGATAGARDAFERALGAHLTWHGGADGHLEEALRDAPHFTMAHVLRAYRHLGSREVVRVRLARWAHARAASLPANARERLHIAVIRTALADDVTAAKALLDHLLEEYPLDVLALQAGHALDYVTGDEERMAGRVASVLPSWSRDLPGYSSVLAMQAFSLMECARHEEATEHGLEALALDPSDVRAHHALTHVHEMTGDAAAGARWLQERREVWSIDSPAATHLWWHTALFRLAQGELGAALELYDERVRAGRSVRVADMIDASALLWRIELRGGEVGRRWGELAAAWTAHIDDGFCTFNDLHAMLALVGARDWTGANRLVEELQCRHALGTRHGETTRLVGLAASEGILAFGRAEYARAAELLSALPDFARRIGGSQAQRDVLYLTLRESARRMHRPRITAAA